MSCDSVNVIYVAICSNGNCEYIGEPGVDNPKL